MKPKKLISEPYRTICEYAILNICLPRIKIIYTNNNFALLLSYIRSKYKSRDIDCGWEIKVVIEVKSNTFDIYRYSLKILYVKKMNQQYIKILIKDNMYLLK